MKARARVALRWDDAAVRRAIGDPGGPVGDALMRLAREVATSARRRAPRATGQLAGSIRAELGGRGGSLQARVVADAPHAVYVHEGTGVYGKRGRMIRPRAARVMAWRDSGGGWVFAKKVRGVPPRPFLKQAAEAVIGRRTL